MSYHLYAIISVLAVSAIAIIAAIPLLITKKLPKTLLVTLLSLSVGTLLGAVVFEFLPEIYGHGHGNQLTASLLILAGFLTFFILEKLIHHKHSQEEEAVIGHGHAAHLAPINLLGDAVHNFIDGLIIAAAYITSIPLGIAATVAVLMHELPQELADMGILLYAGVSRLKAVLLNFAVALTAVAGTIIGLLLAEADHFAEAILPFAAGVFIYIAASNLVPELHRDCGAKETTIHVTAILAGIGIMLALTLLIPHTH